jgi:hypothetical protein
MSLVKLALNGGITGESFGLRCPRLLYYRFLLLPYKHELHACDGAERHGFWHIISRSSRPFHLF